MKYFLFIFCILLLGAGCQSTNTKQVSTVEAYGQLNDLIKDKCFYTDNKEEIELCQDTPDCCHFTGCLIEVSHDCPDGSVATGTIRMYMSDLLWDNKCLEKL